MAEHEAAGRRRRRVKDAIVDPDNPVATARLAAEIARLEAELAAMRAKLHELEARAERDPLTELYNRRGFDHEIARVAAHLRRYGGSAALVMIDLDGFKAVNDHHGHAAGDAVLKATAAALTASVRASDTVARMGGDEFAVLLWNLTPEAAAAKATALEQAIAAASIPWPTGPLAVGASAGIAPFTTADMPADALDRADAAMYARKLLRKGDASR